MSTHEAVRERITWTGEGKHKTAFYGGLEMRTVAGRGHRACLWAVYFGAQAHVHSVTGFAQTVELAKRCAVGVAVRYLREGGECPFEYARWRGWVGPNGNPTAAPLTPGERWKADSLAHELLRCSFAELLERNATGEHPALLVAAPAGDAFDPVVRKFGELADLYDHAQAARGDARRAVRA